MLKTKDLETEYQKILTLHPDLVHVFDGNTTHYLELNDVNLSVISSKLRPYKVWWKTSFDKGEKIVYAWRSRSFGKIENAVKFMREF